MLIEKLTDFLQNAGVLEKLDESENREFLASAGFRTQQHAVKFMVAQVFLPVGTAIFMIIYMGILGRWGANFTETLGIVIGASIMAFFLPKIWVRSKVKKRRDDIRRSLPDCLDLLGICVGAGMSSEQALRRVSEEIYSFAPSLSEEIDITLSELSFLPTRRDAYESFASRVPLEAVKSLTGAIIQSERFGSSLGAALEIVAEEVREMRRNDAEKKAAALPPMLTMPMMVFFLPVLLIMLIAPAGIQVYQNF